MINEIELFSGEDWRSKILRTILLNYKKAPYFEQAFPVIQQAIESPDKTLAKYLINIIYKVTEYLGISTDIMVSSEIEKDNSLKGQNKICDICERVGKRNIVRYINPIGGKDLYSREVFTSKNMEIFFLQPSDIKYKQFTDEFVPWLSIIDIMMFNDVDAIRNLLHKYVLL